MKKHVTIFEMKSTGSSTEINLTLMIGGMPELFKVSIIDEGGILGVCADDELERLLVHNTEKSKLFINSVLDFYKGNSVEMPIEIGDF